MHHVKSSSHYWLIGTVGSQIYNVTEFFFEYSRIKQKRYRWSIFKMFVIIVQRFSRTRQLYYVLVYKKIKYNTVLLTSSDSVCTETRFSVAVSMLLTSTRTRSTSTFQARGPTMT